MKRLRKKLYAIQKEEGIEFVHGTGRRISPIQKAIEQLEEYQEKLKEYTQIIHICGKRNSYSKTDLDATFMRMKEENMDYDSEQDCYVCKNGKKLIVTGTRYDKSKIGCILA